MYISDPFLVDTLRTVKNALVYIKKCFPKIEMWVQGQNRDLSERIDPHAGGEHIRSYQKATQDPTSSRVHCMEMQAPPATPNPKL